MLSTENPPDPSCSCKISGLRSDERASDELALQEADLPIKSCLDHYQLPNFSIRDYVFTARSKDIETNWPFPQQYLQLFLKHGVKGVLPPFESPRLVRNRCFRKGVVSDQLVASTDNRKSVVEVDSFEQKYVGNDLDGVACGPIIPSVLGFAEKALVPLQEQENLTVDPKDTHLCRLSRSPSLNQACGEGEIPDTPLTNAQSERESVPTGTLPYSAQEEANTSSEAAIELQVATSPTSSHKTNNTPELAGKKCNLILKFGVTSDPSRCEDIASNTTTVSESMASKLCPVCKTFSSTSNTTLNAHIDQCLSVESNTSLTVNSNLIKHRVKPRKKRSMVDICATAPRCTLEELDRRNGSNWAIELSMPVPHGEVCTERKRQRLSRIDLEDTDYENAVYFDSNGTKLRIISKSNDAASVPPVGDHSRPRKNLKKIKERKFSSTCIKRCLAPKHSNYLNPKSQSKKLCSPRPDKSEEVYSCRIVGEHIHGASEGNYVTGVNCEKEESLSQLLKAREQMRPSESGTLGQWVCSKRTGLLKKFNGKDGRKGLGYLSSVTQDPLIKSNQSNLTESSVDRSRILKFPKASGNLISPKTKIMESPSDGRTKIVDKRKKSPKPNDCSLNQLSKASTSLALDGCMLKHSRSSGNHTSSAGSKRVEVHTGPFRNSDSLGNATANHSKGCHLLSPKGKKSCTLNNLSVRPYLHKSNFNEDDKSLAFKKSHMHRSVIDKGEHVRALPFDMDKRDVLMYNITENQSNCLSLKGGNQKLDCSNNVLSSEREVIGDGLSFHRSYVLENGQGREGSTSEREEPVSLDGLLSRHECHSLDPAATIYSHFRANQFCCSDNVADKSDGLESASGEVQIDEEGTVIEPSDKAVKGPIIRSSKILALDLRKQANCSDTQFNYFRSFEEYKKPVCGTEALMGPTEPSLSGDQEMTYGNEVCNGIIRKNADMGAEVNCRVGRGKSFTEIDPMSFIGPLGSFFPSPRDLGSEVLQENSSPSSSRIVSSQDRQMLVDRDSSGSPVSATSDISHPPSARSELKYSEPEPSVGPPTVKKKFISSFSDGSSSLAAGDAAAFRCPTGIGGAEGTYFNGDVLKVTEIFPAKGTGKSEDNRPCCCSWKEGISRGAAISYQASQFLRQYTMDPITLPAKGQQVSCIPNIRPEISTSSSTCPSLIINKVVPVLGSPTSPISTDTFIAAVNFPSHGDLDSFSPSSQAHPQSTSNPVLRLMGKNLVVNKDDDASMQLRQSLPGASNDRPNAQYLKLLGFSTGNVPNQDCLSFCHMNSEGSAMVGPDPCNPHLQCSDVGFSNGYISLGNYKAHQTSSQLSASNCHSIHLEGFASSSLQQHGLTGRINLPTTQKRPNRKPSSPLGYNVEKVVIPQLQHQNAVSSAQADSNSIREVIVIEDSPENEADSSMMNAKYEEGLRGSPQSHTHPPDSNFHTYSCYQSYNAFPPREPLVRPKPNFVVSCSGGRNTSSIRPAGTSEGSNVLLHSPFIVPLKLAGHLSPTLYYAPSLP